MRIILISLTSIDDRGKIITWNISTWQRIGSKTVVKDPISALNVSPDGKLLAVSVALFELLLVWLERHHLITRSISSCIVKFNTQMPKK